MSKLDLFVPLNIFLLVVLIIRTLSEPFCLDKCCLKVGVTLLLSKQAFFLPPPGFFLPPPLPTPSPSFENVLSTYQSELLL